MNSLSELYTTAADLFQQGHYSQVETLCRQILRQHPRHHETLHLLGVVYYHFHRYSESARLLHQALTLNNQDATIYLSLGNTLKAMGKTAEAIQCFQVASQLNDRFPEAHINLGIVLYEQRQYEQALQHLHTARQLLPEHPLVRYYLGNVLQDLNRFAEAIHNYRQVLRLAPNYHDPNFFVQFGNALKKSGKPAEAGQWYRRAIKLQPDFAVAYNNLGSVLKATGQLEEAITCHRRAIELDPDNAEAHFNLANALKDSGHVDAAIESYRKAIALQPRFYQAYYNLGKALSEEDRFEEALIAYQQATRIQPKMIAAWNNAGVIHQGLGKTDEAMHAFNRALALDPQHIEVRWNRAILNLLLGNYREAWQDYELRWQRGTMPPRNFPQPVWDGTPVKKQTLLIYAEQGLGDTIQFIRYLPLVKQQVDKIIIESQPAVKELLAVQPEVNLIFSRGESLPPFDLQIALLSLPRIFQTTPETIPQKIPYLQVPGERITGFAQQVDFPSDKQKIGIVWQGNPKHPNDKRRSCPLEHFQILTENKTLALYSLQKDGDTQLDKAFPAGSIVSLAPHLRNFLDTAAAIMLLDLVITVDTSVAHLAGALGKPVWILLPFAPDWRWMLAREDTPWYPTARLFRQRERGNWGEVLKRVARALGANPQQ